MKVSVDFLDRASKMAHEQFFAKVANTCTVHSTQSYTAFETSDGSTLVLPGKLHDAVECKNCVEFDLRYNGGLITFVDQRFF